MIGSRMDIPPQKKGVEHTPEFIETLKRVKSLYYSDLIAQETDSKKGKRVTRESFLQGDQRDEKALRYMLANGKGRIPDKIYDFVLEKVKLLDHKS